MKRWMFRIAMLLVLGAATTVGVAWGLALWSHPKSGATLNATWDHDGERLSAARDSALGRVFIVYLRGRMSREHESGDKAEVDSLRPTWLDASPSPAFVAGDSEMELRLIDSAGLPCIAMLSEGRKLAVGDEETRSYGITTRMEPWVFPAGLIVPRVLPLRPIWPGFIIDTLFYAGVWFVLLFGFTRITRAVRTHRRKRKGLCINCGYDLRGVPSHGQDARATGCPECGWGR